MWTASAWLVEPSIPSTIWFGQLAAEDVLHDNFRGELLSATVNGEGVPSARLGAADSAALHDDFVAGSAVARATVVAGPPTSFPAPIVSIFDLAQSEILVLGQDRRDLIFRIRMGTADHELHLPEIRLPGALAIPGDTVHLAGGLRDGQLFVQARSRHFDQRRSAALSPSWGWMFVLPWHYAMGPEGRWLTTLWVAGLLFPVAFWTARGLRGPREDAPPEIAFRGRDRLPGAGALAPPGRAAGGSLERMAVGGNRTRGGVVAGTAEFHAPGRRGQGRLTTVPRTRWREARR